MISLNAEGSSHTTFKRLLLMHIGAIYVIICCKEADHFEKEGLSSVSRRRRDCRGGELDTAVEAVGKTFVASVN